MQLITITSINMENPNTMCQIMNIRMEKHTIDMAHGCRLFAITVKLDEATDRY